MPSDDDKSRSEREGTVDQLLRAMARGDTDAASPKEDLVGATIAHYRVEAKLGQGGMGVVYRARLAARARRGAQGAAGVARRRR